MYQPEQTLFSDNITMICNDNVLLWQQNELKISFMYIKSKTKASQKGKPKHYFAFPDDEWSNVSLKAA